MDLDALVQAMKDLYATEITVEELREEVGTDRDSLVEEFADDALDEYTAKEESFGENPEAGQPLMRELERFVILQVVDTRWREHLENMDYLREGVHLRAMAQKDPLVEYTSEGHAMFEELNAAIREEVVFTLFHAELAPEDAELLAMQDGQGNGQALDYQHQSLAGADAIAAAGMAGGELGGSVSTAGAAMAPAASGPSSRGSGSWPTRTSSAATIPAGAARARSSRSATALSARRSARRAIFGRWRRGLAPRAAPGKARRG